MLLVRTARSGPLWKSRALADIQVVPNARLTRTLGRLVGRPWRIELGPRALVHARVLRRRSLLGESRVDEMLGRHGAALPFRGASSNSAEVRLEVVE